MTTPIRTVAILSGEDTNVGKSTIARHLLRPSLIREHGSCRYLLVEKLDRKIPEGECERFHPDDMRQIQRELTMCRAKNEGSVIVDVGGGQNPVFMASLKEAKGSDSRIDLFVLPVTPRVKVDKFIDAIEELIEMGVDPSKLTVVLNRVPVGKKATDILQDATFAPLAGHAKKYKYRICNVVLPENAAIDILRKHVTRTIGSIAGRAEELEADLSVLAKQEKEMRANGATPKEIVEIMQDQEDLCNLIFDSSIASSINDAINACSSDLLYSRDVDLTVLL